MPQFTALPVLFGAADDLGWVDEAQGDQQPFQRRHHLYHGHGIDRLAGAHTGGGDGIVERDDKRLAVA